MTCFALAGTEVAVAVAVPGRTELGLAAGAILLLVAVRVGLGVSLALRRHRRRNTLAHLREMTPAAFERAVAGWFAREGWLVEHRGRSGDHGIDVLAFHGEELIAVQCKRYAEGTAVSPAQLRELYGAAVAAGATRALLVTTGRVSQAAAEWAAGLRSAPPRLDLVTADQVVAMASGQLRVAPPGGRQ